MKECTRRVNGLAYQYSKIGLCYYSIYNEMDIFNFFQPVNFENSEINPLYFITLFHDWDHLANKQSPKYYNVVDSDEITVAARCT